VKKILLLINYSIAVFALFAFWGCDASSKPFEFNPQEVSSSSLEDIFIESSSSSVNEPIKISEFVISRDCTSGDESSGIEFAEDSVRCGKKGNIYFGLGQIETDMLPHFDYYLFSDSGAKTTKDCLWILETDSTKYLDCEKLETANTNLSGVFCLKKFDGIVGRERATRHTFFVYKKHNSYSAFCNAEAIDCFLYYSCVVRDDGMYDFIKIPSADDVKRNEIGGCII
jgi:hypothetical protein